MAYEDKTLTCVECQESFQFTAGEQEFYAQRGLTNEPKRCPTCRQARRSTRGGFRGGEGGYEPVRNEVFKKFSTRSMRPVVNFETCTKCTLCWLQCPDSCFDVTPDGLYDSNMESCCGCGVCEDVCPVPDCVTMVNEETFTDNSSQYDHWQRDRDGYMKWLEEKIEVARVEKRDVGRSHGFHEWREYEEQIAVTGVGNDD
mgnify:CR=1 FL=1